jgi:hypothetical protein
VVGLADEKKSEETIEQRGLFTLSTRKDQSSKMVRVVWALAEPHSPRAPFHSTRTRVLPHAFSTVVERTGAGRVHARVQNTHSDAHPPQNECSTLKKQAVTPLTSPVPEALYPALAVSLSAVGLSAAAGFFVYVFECCF